MVHVNHASFTIERVFNAPVEKLYKAFSDQDAKQVWFHGPVEWTVEEQIMDFREGGRETSKGGPADGPLHEFSALYYEIIPQERIVYTYEMYLGGKRISVSLATLEFSGHDDTSKLVVREDGVYFDDDASAITDNAGAQTDGATLREDGTRQLLEAVAKTIEE